MQAFRFLSKYWCNVFINFHFKSFWIITPRTLCEVTTANGWSSIVKGANWVFSLKKHNRNSLNFLALRRIQLPETQLFIWSSVDWEDDKLPLLRFSDNETSSTYFHIPKLGEMALPKSLTIMRNKIGLKLVFWGTPALTGSQSENGSLLCIVIIYSILYKI